MGFDQDGAHSRITGLLRKFEIIEAAAVDVRRTVYVQIHGSFEIVWQVSHNNTTFRNSFIPGRCPTRDGASSATIATDTIGMAKLEVR